MYFKIVVPPQIIYRQIHCNDSDRVFALIMAYKMYPGLNYLFALISEASWFEGMGVDQHAHCQPSLEDLGTRRSYITRSLVRAFVPLDRISPPLENNFPTFFAVLEMHM